MSSTNEESSIFSDVSVEFNLSTETEAEGDDPNEMLIGKQIQSHSNPSRIFFWIGFFFITVIFFTIMVSFLCFMFYYTGYDTGLNSTKPKITDLEEVWIVSDVDKKPIGPLNFPGYHLTNKDSIPNHGSNSELWPPYRCFGYCEECNYIDPLNGSVLELEVRAFTKFTATTWFRMFMIAKCSLGECNSIVKECILEKKV